MSADMLRCMASGYDYGDRVWIALHAVRGKDGGSMSAAEAAELAEEKGLGTFKSLQPSLSKILAGRTKNPTKPTVNALSGVLGVSKGWLWGEDEPVPELVVPIAPREITFDKDGKRVAPHMRPYPELGQGAFADPRGFPLAVELVAEKYKLAPEKVAAIAERRAKYSQDGKKLSTLDWAKFIEVWVAEEGQGFDAVDGSRPITSELD